MIKAKFYMRWCRDCKELKPMSSPKTKVCNECFEINAKKGIEKIRKYGKIKHKLTRIKRNKQLDTLKDKLVTCKW